MKKTERFKAIISGKNLIIETGHLAGQALSSCTVRYGDTVVLATVCVSKEIREGIDYLPLLVDYDEKLYAAGKIKTARFIKREGRPSDAAILSDRLVDRSIRPLFLEDTRNDIQIVLTILSFDQENDPDILGVIGASCALSISRILWRGPVACVRIGQIPSSLPGKKPEWVLNPSYEARAKSLLDLVIVGTKDKIVMLEMGGEEIKEENFLEAIDFGSKHLRKTLRLIEEVQEKIGQSKMKLEEASQEEESQKKLLQKIEGFIADKIEKIFDYRIKEEYHQNIEKLQEELEEYLKKDNEVSKEERAKGLKLIDYFLDRYARKLVLEKNIRVDGRKLDEIRPVSCEVGILPRTHGSGLFTRGETQVLSVVTLGPPSEEQYLETMEETGKRRFMHHYNFPGFSVGEVQPTRFPSRREIGHGALVEKALLPLLPSKEDFPYTTRVVSEVLSSNGSSSMASVCGSSLALMDAGVPIKKAVAGIAMGLITKLKIENLSRVESRDEKLKIEEYKNTASLGSDEYRILTDIQGIEDHSGDMDFKIAGTNSGITVVQMDTKLDGIPREIIEKTLAQAKKARLEILDKMSKVITKPRGELSPYAPRIYTIKINPEKIRDVIGPGGKVINEIIGQTGVTIDIEDDGLVTVTSVKEEAAQKAIDWIKNLTKELKVGEIFSGKVTRLFDFGAMVEVLPRQEGLIHISELAPFRIAQVEDVVKVGDVVPVKVISIDEQGRVNLSLKETDFDFSHVKPADEVVRPRIIRSRTGYQKPGGGLSGRTSGYQRRRY